VTRGGSFKKTYFREYTYHLKSNRERLSATFCLWNVYFQCSAIISQHTENPFALVPPFHGENVLVKTLSVLIAHGSEIFWEEV